MKQYYPGYWLFTAYRGCRPYRSTLIISSATSSTTPLTSASVASPTTSLTTVGITTGMPAYQAMKTAIAEWEAKNAYLLKSRTTREKTLDDLKRHVEASAKLFFANSRPGLMNLIEEERVKIDNEVRKIRKIEAKISNLRMFKDLHTDGDGFGFFEKYHTMDELFDRLDSHFSHKHFETLGSTTLTWLGAGIGLGAVEELKNYIALSGLELGILIFVLGVGLYLIDEFFVKPFQIEMAKEEVKRTLENDDGEQRDFDDVILFKTKGEKILEGLTEAQLHLSENASAADKGLEARRQVMASGLK